MLSRSELITDFIRKDEILSVNAEKDSDDLVRVFALNEISLALELEENFHACWDATKSIFSVVHCS